MRRNATTIGLLITAAVVIFFLLILCRGINHSNARPQIYSDARQGQLDSFKRADAVYSAQSIWGAAVPEDPTDLYFARRGGWGGDNFAAFRLENEEAREAFFARIRGLDKFKEGTLSAEGPWHDYDAPNTWSDRWWRKDLQDPNWRLSAEDKFLYFGDTDQLCIYVPDDMTVYLFDDGAP